MLNLIDGPTPYSVGVVGASGRAAVMSLARAGFSAWAVDLFADRDLARLAPCARCPVGDYPNGIPALAEKMVRERNPLAERADHFPVLYTGGLENHPEVVRELASGRPLWGNGPGVLERVRDPLRLAECLHGNDFSYPRLIPPGEACPTTGNWLMKARRSSGGLGVRSACPGEQPGPESYLQEFIPGPPMSAVFVADQQICRLVGVTEQLIGVQWLHAHPFHYTGNIGPVPVVSTLEKELAQLGDRLMTAAGVRGVFGVDFILHDGRARVIEVNPRYPASVEVLELAGGFSTFASPVSWRAGSVSDRSSVSPVARAPGSPASQSNPNPDIIGKAIYYAPHPIIFPAAGPWDADLAGPFDPWRLPAFADIPAAGERIEAGSPVLTFFAPGSTPDECRERLQSRAAELDQLFGRDAERSDSP